MKTQKSSSIASGDTANSAHWSFPNHAGTHIDAPRHFYDEGAAITDYPPDWWIFERPCLLDVPVDADVLISPEHLRDPVPPGTDLLLLRTGFEAVRGTDRYWSANPGLSPELARWLRAEHPGVRAIGMDLLSVTAFAHRVEGRVAHRAFLDPQAPILPIEDMALAAVSGRLDRVIVLPLRVPEADGGPCTVLAFCRTAS